MTKATEAFEKWWSTQNPDHYDEMTAQAAYEQGRADLLVEIKTLKNTPWGRFDGVTLYRLPEGDEA